MAFNPCGNDDTNAASTDNIEVAMPKEAPGPAELDAHHKLTDGCDDAQAARRTSDDRGGDGSVGSTSRKKSTTAPVNSPGTSITSERPVKKMKRGKYISRAWCVHDPSMTPIMLRVCQAIQY